MAVDGRVLKAPAMVDISPLGCATVLACALAGGNAAAVTCVPAEDFTTFLARYQSDASFQRQRIGRRVAVMDLAGREEQAATRESVTRDSFVEKAYGTFPEKAWIAQERLEMTIEILSADKADAHVFAPHSDSFSRHYMFSRTHGCWRLTAFTRDSL